METQSRTNLPGEARAVLSRNVVLLLVGILGLAALAVDAGQANADIIIDHFTGTNAPGSPTVISGVAPSFYTASNPTAWEIQFAPASTSIVNTTVTEPAPVSGAISGWGRSTNLERQRCF